MWLEPRGGGTEIQGDPQEAGASTGGNTVPGGLRYESVWAMPTGVREQVVSQVVAKVTARQKETDEDVCVNNKEETIMRFSEALKAMKKGYKVKLPSWAGY